LPQVFDITGALGIEKLDKDEKEVCVLSVYVLLISMCLYNLVVFYYSTDARNLSVKQVTTPLRMH